MGQVIIDEREKPLMRMTFRGVPDEAKWQRGDQLDARLGT